MLQPKAYSKEKQKVYDVKYIDFDNETLELLTEQQFDFYAQVYDYDEVEFMENTGCIDKNGAFIYIGDIVEILGVYFEIKYRVLKGYVIENKEYTLSLEANLDSVSVVGNIYENKELVENE